MKRTTENHKKETVSCPKCDGKGHIVGFSHYANGVCFECYGAGIVEIDCMAPNEKLDCLCGSLRYTADTVLIAAQRGDDERASFYLGRMLDDMFRIGTRRAREVLDYLGAGQFWNDEEQRFFVVKRPRALELRAELIELGRARKAERQAA